MEKKDLLAEIEELRIRLKEAEEAITVAKIAAEEASRAKSEVLANMSHEIRTPMSVFMAAIQHLLQIDRNPQRRHLLGMAEQSAKDLRSLIDDILDFSRIEARRVELEDEPFDLRACVREAVEMLSLQVTQKNLRLETDISPDVPDIVHGDPNRLRQVLINLIGNAIKFTSEGEIHVSTRTRDDFLEFAVTDTGIGIPEEKRHKLFQSFSQVDGSLTRRNGGIGLGLAISKGLVELMGGEILVRSRDGEGSVFTFTLHLRNEGSPHPSPAEALPEASWKVKPGIRILLVEDEPQAREVIGMMLARRGWQAEVAESGWAALEKWMGGDYNVILMDLQMPGMNGLEATQAIRKREAGSGRRACIIGLTAHSRREIQEACIASGMDRVLTKPVQINDLLGAIDSFAPDRD